jgi:hypothetical protein
VKIVASQNDAEQVGVLIRKNEGELQQAINKALDGIKADGTTRRFPIPTSGPMSLNNRSAAAVIAL